MTRGRTRTHDLEAMMELNNLVDKYTLGVKKKYTYIDHLPKGPNARFAKTIFFLPRGDYFSTCTAVVKATQ